MKQRLLITGGSGFIGRHLASAWRGEYEIFLGSRNTQLNQEAAAKTGCAAVPLDICSIESIRDVFAEVRPNVVVHCAAMKHVPLAEVHPMECIDVNVTGSQNLARVAIEKGAQAVIGVSTDKAAPPVTNIYAASKALMERMFCGLNDKTATRFACVRFGNVAWSTGSVLPVWKGMLENDGIIHSTGPDMRRFMFTVDEAVNLIGAALRNLEITAGQVLTCEMKAVLIRDLLEFWVDQKGGRWMPAAPRQGDSQDEILIGEAEAPYTSRVSLEGRDYLQLSFGERSKQPLAHGIDTTRAPMMDASDMARICEERLE